MELDRQIVSTETARQYDQLVELMAESQTGAPIDGFALFSVMHIIAVLEMQRSNARRFDFGAAVEETAKVIKMAEEYKQRIMNPAPNE